MIKNMFTHLITLALGFAAGCTFKEVLEKRKNRTETNNNPINHSPAHPREDAKTGNRSNHSSDFSLQSLKSTFSSYNVSLLATSSFGALLREVRSSCYKDILRIFLEKATTPEIMVEMLKNQIIPDKDFIIESYSGAPYISKEKLESYIIEEGVPATEFNSNENRVKFLLSLYHAKGIEDFKNTLGSDLSDILTFHENGDNITEAYNAIMKLIKSRYEYLS